MNHSTWHEPESIPYVVTLSSTCQIFIILERTVNVEIVAWWLRKPAVVVSHELIGKGVCCLGRTDTANDEAILQRQVSPAQHEQCAGRTMILAPTMLTTINLDFRRASRNS